MLAVSYVKNLYKCSLQKNSEKGGILMLYIGVDLGTSACKFLLVDETGKVCNQVTREYPLSMPHTGWSEQDPAAWWQACLE